MTSRSLEALLSELPYGRQRVALTLIEDDGMTYRQVAERLELSIGTVHRHLKRIRDKHPDTYAALMAYRAGQLKHRHAGAIRRARAHTTRWFRRKRARNFYYQYGRWPWER